MTINRFSFPGFESLRSHSYDFVQIHHLPNSSALANKSLWWLQAPRETSKCCRSRTSKHPTQFYHKSSFRLWEIKTRKETRKNPDWACPADWSLTIWSDPGGVHYTGARRAPKRPLRVAGHRLKSRETREPRRTPWQSGGCHRKVPVQVRERSGPWFSGAREIANSGRGKRIGQMEENTSRHPHPSPSRSPVLQPHESQSDHMRHV